jgi:hypothetical protein
MFPLETTDRDQLEQTTFLDDSLQQSVGNTIPFSDERQSSAVKRQLNNPAKLFKLLYC